MPRQEDFCAARDYDLNGMTALVALLDSPTYPPYVEDAPHTHNCMEIGQCLSGKGTITVDGRTWPFAAGTLTVAPRGTLHHQKNFGEPMTHWRYVMVNTEILLMETPPKRREAVADTIDRIPSGVFTGPETLAAEIRSVMDSMFRAWQERKTMDSMEMDALTRLLIARLGWMPDETLIHLPDGGPARRAVEPALRHVSENYMLDMRISDMAAACAMSESYFRKLFGQVMGMSPVEYLNRYRVNRSIYYLRATDETVLTVAGLSGFASLTSFNRNFLKYVGVSPSQWRRTASENGQWKMDNGK